jgi:hypothetical protein
VNRHFFILFISAAIGISAGSVYSYDTAEFETYTPARFRDYWYNHGAELSHFTLEQIRYGEIHEGDAVLVFVTEDINPQKAIAKLVAVAEKSLEGNSLVRYEIDFPEDQRTLRIYFEKSSRLKTESVKGRIA